MEAVLDIAAGTGIVLLLLATAFIERAWGRLLTAALVAAVAYAVYPIVLRQSLPAFIGSLDGADVQTVAAILAFDGVVGCAGATLLLRARHAPPFDGVRWVRRLAAYQVGVIPVPALFYLEMKVVRRGVGMVVRDDRHGLVPGHRRGGCGGERGDPTAASRISISGVELRLLVHVGQVVLAAGLTAYALQGGVERSATALEAGPHAVVAGVAVLGMLVGYWSHRRAPAPPRGLSPWSC